MISIALLLRVFIVCASVYDSIVVKPFKVIIAFVLWHQVQNHCKYRTRKSCACVSMCVSLGGIVYCAHFVQ